MRTPSISCKIEITSSINPSEDPKKIEAGNKSSKFIQKPKSGFALHTLSIHVGWVP